MEFNSKEMFGSLTDPYIASKTPAYLSKNDAGIWYEGLTLLSSVLSGFEKYERVKDRTKQGVGTYVNSSIAIFDAFLTTHKETLKGFSSFYKSQYERLMIYQNKYTKKEEQ